MQFGYTIIYVADVAATVTFYDQALGITKRFTDDKQQYAELETGATALAFAAEAMATLNGVTIRPNRPNDVAPAVEIALVTSDVAAAYDRAVSAGAAAIHPPAQKPWGQTVAYVRDLNGLLIELCSPHAG